MTDIPIGISHLGICVSDWKRSKRFYSEALGFELDHEAVFESTAPFDRLTELDTDEMRWRGAVYKGFGFTIELMQYEDPPHIGTGERRPMNKLGISHFCFVVDDLDAVVGRIVEYGGRVLDHTRMSANYGEFIMCVDPDGVRLELWQKAAA